MRWFEILLALALAGIWGASADAATWRSIGRGANGVPISYDGDSLVRRGEVRAFSLRYDYGAVPEAGAPAPIFSASAELRCKARQIRFLKGSYEREDGTIVHTFTPPAEFGDIVPDGDWAMIHRALCPRR